MKRTGGGIQFGKIGLDKMNLNQLADRQTDSSVPSQERLEKPKIKFGSFGKKKELAPVMREVTNEVSSEKVAEVVEPEIEAFAEEDNSEMMQLMGFGSFGSTHKSLNEDKAVTLQREVDRKVQAMQEQVKKKAMTFDVESMFANAAASAQQRNMAANSKLEEEGRAEQETGFVIPQKKKEAVKVGEAEEESDEEDSESDGEDAVGPMPPPMAPPPIPQGTKDSKVKKGGEGDDDDSEEEDSDSGEELDDSPVNRVPWTHEIKLQHGDRAITSLALDPGGARVVSGGIDHEMKLWDFAGMDPSLRSFRGKKPMEGHALNDLRYSTTGDKILVCANKAQIKVLGRDGDELLETLKGDQYVLDQTRNKGHVNNVNAGRWHPKIKSEFMTCANDATLRLWELDHAAKKSKTVIKCKAKKTGLRCNPTTCTYSRDGLLVCAGCNDGSIQMWDHRKNFVRTCLALDDAHEFNVPITGVDFGYDNRLLATRSNDGTLKLWDIRNFKKAVNIATGLPSKYDQMDVLFSPDDRLVLTGTSMEKGDDGGKLVFFDKTTFDRAFEISVGKSHVIRTTWHPKLNQILVGCGDGAVRVFYDPSKSVRGAMLCIVKKRTEARASNWVHTQRVITPYALPMFKEERRRQSTTYRQMIRDRKDPKKSHNPDPPMEHKGTGGMVAAGGSTLHSWMAKQIAVKNKDDHIDPRERILRHAQDSTDNPYWISPAYKHTQPVPVFRSESEDEPPEKRTKSVHNIAGISGAGGFKKPERQTKRESQLGQH